MAIEASEDLNNTFWALTGLRMPYANEDKALRSAIPLNGLANDVLKANEYISGTLLGAARALPPQVGNAYLKAVSLLVDDGGTNHLKNFADQLMEIADGRRKTAMNIVEGKVQLIAEVVRLILELLVLTVLSVFSGGASAGDIAIAKAATRLRILTILDLLIKRTHLMPSVSEAFEEAFTTFAVRLSLIAGGPDGLRPKGIDWGAIGKDGLFGALGGAFSHALPGMENKLKNLLKTFDEHSTFDSKNLVQDVTKKLDGPGLSGAGRNVPDRSVRDAGTLTGGNGLSHALGNVTSAGGGAVRTFTYEGLSETLAEFLGTGLFDGKWAWSWATMLGAGTSSVVTQGLFLGVGLGAGALFASKFNFGNIASVLNAGVNAPAGAGATTGNPAGAHGVPAGAGGPGVVSPAGGGNVNVKPVKQQDFSGLSTFTPGAGTGRPDVTTVSSDTHMPGTGGTTHPAGGTTSPAGSPIGAGAPTATPGRPVTSSTGPAGEQPHTLQQPDSGEHNEGEAETGPAHQVPAGSGHTPGSSVTSPAGSTHTPTTPSRPTTSPLDTTDTTDATGTTDTTDTTDATGTTDVTGTTGSTGTTGASDAAGTAPAAAHDGSTPVQPSGSPAGGHQQTPTTSSATPTSTPTSTSTPPASVSGPVTGAQASPAAADAAGSGSHNPAGTTQPTTAAAQRTADDSPITSREAHQAEHDVWQRLFATPSDDHQALIDELAAQRGGIAPTQREIDLRQGVHSQLGALPGVMVTLEDGAGFGQHAAAATLINSLNALGYPGRFTLAAPDTVADRLVSLIPAHLGPRIDRHPTDAPDTTGQAGLQANDGSELPGDWLTSLHDRGPHGLQGWAQLHDADDALSALATLPPTTGGGLRLDPGPLRQLSAVLDRDQLTTILGPAATLKQVAGHHGGDPLYSGNPQPDATALTISPDQLTRLRAAVTAYRDEQIAAVQNAAAQTPALTPDQVVFLADTIRRSLRPETRLHTTFGTPNAQPRSTQEEQAGPLSYSAQSVEPELSPSVPTVSTRDAIGATGPTPRPVTSTPLTTSTDPAINTDTDTDTDTDAGTEPPDDESISGDTLVDDNSDDRDDRDNKGDKNAAGKEDHLKRWLHSLTAPSPEADSPLASAFGKTPPFNVPAQDITVQMLSSIDTNQRIDERVGDDSDDADTLDSGKSVYEDALDSFPDDPTAETRSSHQEQPADVAAETPVSRADIDRNLDEEVRFTGILRPESQDDRQQAPPEPIYLMGRGIGRDRETQFEWSSVSEHSSTRAVNYRPLPPPAVVEGVAESDAGALGDAEIIPTWFRQSAVPGQPRSAVVQRVDAAVRSWMAGSRTSGDRSGNRQQLRTIIEALEAWNGKPDRSIRSEAASRLLAHVRAQHAWWDDASSFDPVLPSAIAPPAANELVRDLPLMTPRERAQTLDSLSTENRRWLARNGVFVDALHEALPAGEFAATGARLLVEVPEGSEEPASARHEAHAQISRLLQDGVTAARLLKAGARVVIVPRDVSMTSLPLFHELRGGTSAVASGQGRGFDATRGLGGRSTAVTEENLLGASTRIAPSYPDGYSTTTHEFAHAIHWYALTPEDLAAIDASYRNRYRRGIGAEWPDGTTQANDKGNRIENYSSSNVEEYFAQLTNAYLGTNHGTDPYSGQQRNNGSEWVRANVSELVPLLERLYGSDPMAIHREQANPVNATRADKEMYDSYRDFMEQVDESSANVATPDHLTHESPETGPGASVSHKETAHHLPMPPSAENNSVSAWSAQIRFSEAAKVFEERLGRYLVQRPESLVATRQAVQVIWETLEKGHPQLLPLLGAQGNDWGAGNVGNNVSTLRNVVRSGNLRELSAMLFYAVSSDALAEVIDPPSYDDFPEIGKERAWRRKFDVENLPKSLRPQHVVPPLSAAERKIAIRKDKSGKEFVAWLPATVKMDLPVQAPLHQSGQTTGALVATGTSGSMAFTLEALWRLQQHSGRVFDLQEIRLGLIGHALAAKHHTLHELLRSAQMWDEAHGETVSYVNEWSRYRHIPPLTEEELRAYVAAGGLFPDEIALGVRSPQVHDVPATGAEALTALGIDPASWDAHLNATAPAGGPVTRPGERLRLWSQWWQASRRVEMIDAEEALRQQSHGPDGQTLDRQTESDSSRVTHAAERARKQRDSAAQALQRLGHDPHTLTAQFEAWVTEQQSHAQRARGAHTSRTFRYRPLPPSALTEDQQKQPHESQTPAVGPFGHQAAVHQSKVEQSSVHPVEVGRAEVVPPPAEVVAWAGNSAGLPMRAFEVRRVSLGDGQFVSVVVVRVVFAPQEDADGVSPSAEDVLEVAARAQRGITRFFNGGLRLPSGDRLQVTLQAVDDAAHAHHVVKLYTAVKRTTSNAWPANVQAFVAAHEIGHLIGLRDEYREAAYGPRPVYDDGALMVGFLVDQQGRALLDEDRLPKPAGHSRMTVAPRHLRQLGAAVDQALGVARPRIDGETAFATEDAIAPRSDGLPARAHFSLEVRQAVLYGDTRTGRAGALPSRGISARPRREPEWMNENNTFSAISPLPGAGEETTRVAPVAGDIVAPFRLRRQMMFPEYWTEDDAVYAAEQSYLHALRGNNVTVVPGRDHIYTWVGEYGGVRIEGELRGDVFTSFRLAQDQSGLKVPPYLPAPVQIPRPIAGPAFGHRVEDIAAYGDRVSRTGAHHRLPARNAFGRGVHAKTVETLNNGTHAADVYFLDPELGPRDVLAELPSRWRLHTAGKSTVLFPEAWTPQQVLDNVEQAHLQAVTSERTRLLDNGAYHWVGDSNGVRIEGLVRNGQYVAYRPTAHQPYTDWPSKQQPVAVTPLAPLTGTDHVKMQRVLFPNGQHALQFAVYVHLDLEPGADAAAAAAIWRLLQLGANMWTKPRSNSGTLVRFGLVRVQQPGPTAVSLPIGPENLSAEQIARFLTDLFPVKSDQRSIEELTQSLIAKDPDPLWMAPTGSVTDTKMTGTAFRKNLQNWLLRTDVLVGPTTLSAYDPTDSNTAEQHAPTLLEVADVQKAFAPGLEPVMSQGLPRNWTRDDLLAAAYTTYVYRASANARFKVLPQDPDTDTSVVQGLFRDVAVEITIRGEQKQIVAVLGTTASPGSAEAPSPQGQGKSPAATDTGIGMPGMSTLPTTTPIGQTPTSPDASPERLARLQAALDTHRPSTPDTPRPGARPTAPGSLASPESTTGNDESATPPPGHNPGNDAVSFDHSRRGGSSWRGESSARVIGEMAGQAARAAADMEATRLAQTGPVPGPAWGQYCLRLIEDLANRLTGRIRTGRTADDLTLHAGEPARRHLNIPTDLWHPVTDYTTLTHTLAQTPPGTLAYLITGRPSHIGHAAAIAHTTDHGLILINPTTPGHHTLTPLTTTSDRNSSTQGSGVRGAAGTGTQHTDGKTMPDTVDGLTPGALLADHLPAPVHSRVLITGPDGHLITPTPQPTTTPTIQALTDPTHPHTGKFAPIQHGDAERLRDYINASKEGGRTRDKIGAELFTRSRSSGDITTLVKGLEEYPARYRTWNKEGTTYYRLIIDPDTNKEYQMPAGAIDARDLDGTAQPQLVVDPAVLAKVKTAVDNAGANGIPLHDFNGILSKKNRKYATAAVQALIDTGDYRKVKQGKGFLIQLIDAPDTQPQAPDPSTLQRLADSLEVAGEKGMSRSDILKTLPRRYADKVRVNALLGGLGGAPGLYRTWKVKPPSRGLVAEFYGPAGPPVGPEYPAPANGSGVRVLGDPWDVGLVTSARSHWLSTPEGRTPTVVQMRTAVADHLEELHTGHDPQGSHVWQALEHALLKEPSANWSSSSDEAQIQDDRARLIAEIRSGERTPAAWVAIGHLAPTLFPSAAPAPAATSSSTLGNTLGPVGGPQAAAVIPGHVPGTWPGMVPSPVAQDSWRLGSSSGGHGGGVDDPAGVEQAAEGMGDWQGRSLGAGTSPMTEADQPVAGVWPGEDPSAWYASGDAREGMVTPGPDAAYSPLVDQGPAERGEPVEAPGDPRGGLWSGHDLSAGPVSEYLDGVNAHLVGPPAGPGYPPPAGGSDARVLGDPWDVGLVTWAQGQWLSTPEGRTPTLAQMRTAVADHLEELHTGHDPQGSHVWLALEHALLNQPLANWSSSSDEAQIQEDRARLITEIRDGARTPAAWVAIGHLAPTHFPSAAPAPAATSSSTLSNALGPVGGPQAAAVTPGHAPGTWPGMVSPPAFQGDVWPPGDDAAAGFTHEDPDSMPGILPEPGQEPGQEPGDQISGMGAFPFRTAGNVPAPNANDPMTSGDPFPNPAQKVQWHGLEDALARTWFTPDEVASIKPLPEKPLPEFGTSDQATSPTGAFPSQTGNVHAPHTDDPMTGSDPFPEPVYQQGQWNGPDDAAAVTGPGNAPENLAAQWWWPGQSQVFMATLDPTFDTKLRNVLQEAVGFALNDPNTSAQHLTRLQAALGTHQPAASAERGSGTRERVELAQRDWTGQVAEVAARGEYVELRGGARRSPRGGMTGGVPGLELAVESRNPRIWDRPGLLREIGQVVAAGHGGMPGSAGLSPHEMSEQECLILLQSLRDSLFPQGIAPARAVDDSVLDGRTQEGPLALGPGWRTVASFDRITEALAAAGPGTAAFVLARRSSGRGHAFAAYALPGTSDGGIREDVSPTEIVWIDLTAGGDRQLAARPPGMAPLEARAVIIDKNARVAAGALPEHIESTSVQALIDPAGTHQYGALGIEVEFHQDLGLKSPDAPDVYGQVIATHTSGADLTFDARRFWRSGDSLYMTWDDAYRAGHAEPIAEDHHIPEFVSAPASILPGETRTLDLKATKILLESTRRHLNVTEAKTLGEILHGRDGWSVEPHLMSHVIHPAPAGGDGENLYTQMTVGLPVDGFLSLLHLNDARTDGMAYDLLDLSRGFGRIYAEKFVSGFYGYDIPDSGIYLLTSDRLVREVWGYGWLAFNHAAALFLSAVNHRRLAKNWVPTASRNPLGELHAALHPAVQDFFEREYGNIEQNFVRVITGLAEKYQDHEIESPIDQLLYIPIGDEGNFTPRDYLAFAFRGNNSGRPVSQRDAIGMRLDPLYDRLEMQDGIPLALLELRQFGSKAGLVSSRQRNQYLREVSDNVRQSFLNHRQEATTDHLGEMAKRILSHPDVSQIAPLLKIIPRMVVAGPPGTPETTHSDQTLFLARSLDEFTQNRPLPARAIEELNVLSATIQKLLSEGVSDLADPEVRAGLIRAIQAVYRLSTPHRTEIHRPTEQTVHPSFYPGGPRGGQASHRSGLFYPQGGQNPWNRPGGSRDTGLDPTGLPLGHRITVEGPEARSVVTVPHTPTRPMGDAKGKQQPAWTRFELSDPSRPHAQFGYDVSDTGEIHYSHHDDSDGNGDGEGVTRLSADGWTAYGDDFLHLDHGVILRGDTGWIGRIDNWDTLHPTLDTPEPTHTLRSDGHTLHITPHTTHTGPTLRLPLTPTTTTTQPSARNLPRAPETATSHQPQHQPDGDNTSTPPTEPTTGIVADVTGPRTDVTTAVAFESLAVIPSDDGTDGQFLHVDPQSAPPHLQTTEPGQVVTEGAARFESGVGLTRAPELTQELKARLHDDRVRSALIVRSDVEGLAYDSRLDITWYLNPRAEIPLREVGLNDQDTIRLVLAKPAIDPGLATSLRRHHDLSAESAQQSPTPVAAHDDGQSAPHPGIDDLLDDVDHAADDRAAFTPDADTERSHADIPTPSTRIDADPANTPRGTHGTPPLAMGTGNRAPERRMMAPQRRVGALRREWPQGADPVQHVQGAGPGIVHVHRYSGVGDPRLSEIAGIILDASTWVSRAGHPKPEIKVIGYTEQNSSENEAAIRNAGMRAELVYAALSSLLSEGWERNISLRAFQDKAFDISVEVRSAAEGGVNVEVLYLRTESERPRPATAALASTSAVRATHRTRPGHATQEPPLRTESDVWKERILQDFGVSVNSKTVAEAVNTAYSTNVSKPLKWDASSLSQVHAALNHYRPIIDRQRAAKSGGKLGIKKIGFLSTFPGEEIENFRTAGIHFDSVVALFSTARKILAGRDQSAYRPDGIKWVTTHEIAHSDMFDDALQEFIEQFRQRKDSSLVTAEDGITETPESDFRESIRWFLRDPERLRTLWPRRARAIDRLIGPGPGPALRTGETRTAGARRIAAELAAYLPWFTRMVGEWDENGHRTTYEEAISEYAQTSPREDFAETATHYFNDREYLREYAPQRAAFFDRLVKSWESWAEPSTSHTAHNRAAASRTPRHMMVKQATEHVTEAHAGRQGQIGPRGMDQVQDGHEADEFASATDGPIDRNVVSPADTGGVRVAAGTAMTSPSQEGAGYGPGGVRPEPVRESAHDSLVVREGPARFPGAGESAEIVYGGGLTAVVEFASDGVALPLVAADDVSQDGPAGVEPATGQAATPASPAHEAGEGKTAAGPTQIPHTGSASAQTGEVPGGRGRTQGSSAVETVPRGEATGPEQESPAGLAAGTGDPHSDDGTAPGSTIGVARALEQAENLYQSVNLALPKSERPVSREVVEQIRRELVEKAGGSLGRINTRALATDIAARVLGRELPRMRAGVGAAMLPLDEDQRERYQVVHPDMEGFVFRPRVEAIVADNEVHHALTGKRKEGVFPRLSVNLMQRYAGRVFRETQELLERYAGVVSDRVGPEMLREARASKSLDSELERFPELASFHHQRPGSSQTLTPIKDKGRTYYRDTNIPFDEMTEWAFEVGGTAVSVHTDPTEPEQLTQQRIEQLEDAVSRVQDAGFSVPAIRVYLPKYAQPIAALSGEDTQVDKKAPKDWNADGQFFQPDMLVLSPRLLASSAPTREADGTFTHLDSQFADSGMATIIHELGHFLHHTQNPSHFYDTTTATELLDKKPARALSAYATDPLEFPAEAFLALVMGRPLTPEQDALYTALGGPRPTGPLRPPPRPPLNADQLRDLTDAVNSQLRRRRLPDITTPWVAENYPRLRIDLTWSYPGLTAAALADIRQYGHIARMHGGAPDTTTTRAHNTATHPADQTPGAGPSGLHTDKGKARQTQQAPEPSLESGHPTQSGTHHATQTGPSPAAITTALPAPPTGTGEEARPSVPAGRDDTSGARTSPVRPASPGEAVPASQAPADPGTARTGPMHQTTEPGQVAAEGAARFEGGVGLSRDSELTQELKARLHDDPVRSALIVRSDLEGLAYDSRLDITWDLNPRAEIPLREVGLNDQDTIRLVLAKPAIDPGLATSLRRHHDLSAESAQQSPTPVAAHDDGQSAPHPGIDDLLKKVDQTPEGRPTSRSPRAPVPGPRRSRVNAAVGPDAPAAAEGLGGELSIDVAPAVDYKLVHPGDQDFVVESNLGEVVWNFSNTEPHRRFLEGLVADEPTRIVPLWEWQLENTASTYVSTTRNSDLWYGARRYRYKVETSMNADARGIDANATIQRQRNAGILPVKAVEEYDEYSEFTEEEEVSFTGMIQPGAFVSVYDRKHNRTGKWNSELGDVEWIDGAHDGARSFEGINSDVAPNLPLQESDGDRMPASTGLNDAARLAPVSSILEEHHSAAEFARGAGEVVSDRWIPYGANKRNGQPAGQEAFSFTRSVSGRLRVLRLPQSGERLQVGYAWIWHGGASPAADVLSMTRRIHLRGNGVSREQISDVEARVKRGLDDLINRRGYRLPALQPNVVFGPQWPGPILRVGVEFVGNEHSAHEVVEVVPGLPIIGLPMRTNRWYADVASLAFVHEIVHGLGCWDDRPNEKVLLTPGGRGRQVLADGESSIMDAIDTAGSFVLTADHLQQIAEIFAPHSHTGVFFQTETSGIKSEYAAWNDFANRDPDNAKWVLEHTNSLFRKHAAEHGTGNDLVRRLYDALTPHERSLSSIQQANLLFNKAVANRKYPMLGGVNESMLHAEDDGYAESEFGEILWRSTNVEPSIVFQEGFEAKNVNNIVSIDAWVRENPEAQFVATTRSWLSRFRGARYRYQINTRLNFDPTGVDVNAHFENRKLQSPLPGEREVVFTSSISPAAIVNVYDWQTDKTGTWDPVTERVAWKDGGKGLSGRPQ